MAVAILCAASSALAQPPPPRFVAKQPVMAAIEVVKNEGIVGEWACGSTSLVVSLDLDNAWLVFATPQGERHRTYDPISKLWTQYTLTAGGELLVETSLGEENGEWVFGNAGVRDHERHGADGTLAWWGEVRVYGRWVKTYETSCARA